MIQEDPAAEHEDPEHEVVSTANPEVISIGTQVEPEMISQSVQSDPSPEVISTSAVPEPTPTDHRVRTIGKLAEVAQQIGLSYNFATLSSFVSSGSVGFQSSGGPLGIHNSSCSWRQHYPVLSFLINGHLHAEYSRLSGWLGLPSCSGTQWHRIIERLEVHVTKLAEWSCGQVRQQIVKRGDDKKWVASFDGFYLTRGHYSNNASASLHDYNTGDIAWFSHRTKRGTGHNWEGTSGGAEADMLNEVLGKVRDAGFIVGEIITDKDSSVNAIFCRHFPEGTITYCSNHCAKTLHKDLQRIKQNKCEASYCIISLTRMHIRLSIAVSGSQVQVQAHDRGIHRELQSSTEQPDLVRQDQGKRRHLQVLL